MVTYVYSVSIATMNVRLLQPLTRRRATATQRQDRNGSIYIIISTNMKNVTSATITIIRIMLEMLEEVIMLVISLIDSINNNNNRSNIINHRVHMVDIKVARNSNNNNRNGHTNQFIIISSLNNNNTKSMYILLSQQTIHHRILLMFRIVSLPVTLIIEWALTNNTVGTVVSVVTRVVLQCNIQHECVKWLPLRARLLPFFKELLLKLDLVLSMIRLKHSIV